VLPLPSKIRNGCLLFVYGVNFDFITYLLILQQVRASYPLKEPDVFELIRGKCNKIQALPYEITLITNNLPN
jgi:argininosuccinate lyase